jgi:hypothetical protein
VNVFGIEPEDLRGFKSLSLKPDGVENFGPDTACWPGLKSDSNWPEEEGLLPSHVKLREWECEAGKLKYDLPWVSSPQDSGGNKGVSGFFFLRRNDGVLDIGPGLDSPPKAYVPLEFLLLSSFIHSLFPGIPVHPSMVLINGIAQWGGSTDPPSKNLAVTGDL